LLLSPVFRRVSIEPIVDNTREILHDPRKSNNDVTIGQAVLSEQDDSLRIMRTILSFSDFAPTI
jgi:hypothetical protein